MSRGAAPSFNGTRGVARPLSRSAAALYLVVATIVACSNEARPVGPDLPQTPPTRADDPRIDRYQKNAFQISQGSRYYTWYGCGGCHTNGAGGPDLGLGRWRHGDGFDAVYASIAHGHAGDEAKYETRIPVEQLWQMTAYVRDLPTLDPAKRRRQDHDAVAEPQGRKAPAPLR